LWKFGSLGKNSSEYQTKASSPQPWTIIPIKVIAN
jgi:hypothetical protein